MDKLEIFDPATMIEEKSVNLLIGPRCSGKTTVLNSLANPEFAAVFDDYFRSMDELALTNLIRKETIFAVGQHSREFAPDIRGNADNIFMFRTTSSYERQYLWNYWIPEGVEYEDFCNLLDKLGIGECIVASRSKNKIYRLS